MGFFEMTHMYFPPPKVRALSLCWLLWWARVLSHTLVRSYVDRKRESYTLFVSHRVENSGVRGGSVFPRVVAEQSTLPDIDSILTGLDHPA